MTAGAASKFKSHILLEWLHWLNWSFKSESDWSSLIAKPLTSSIAVQLPYRSNFEIECVFVCSSNYHERGGQCSCIDLHQHPSRHHGSLSSKPWGTAIVYLQSVSGLFEWSLIQWSRCAKCAIVYYHAYWVMLIPWSGSYLTSLAGWLRTRSPPSSTSWSWVIPASPNSYH